MIIHGPVGYDSRGRGFFEPAGNKTAGFDACGTGPVIAFRGEPGDNAESGTHLFFFKSPDRRTLIKGNALFPETALAPGVGADMDLIFRQFTQDQCHPESGVDIIGMGIEKPNILFHNTKLLLLVFKRSCREACFVVKVTAGIVLPGVTH